VRALATAQSIRMGMAAANAGMASAALSQYAAQQENGTLERGIVDELARGYGQISQAAAGASTSYARLARQRFQASAESRDFQFMMIQAERGFGIAQIAKADGAVRGLIAIGRDKTPSYEVDDVARRVYYRPDESRILGYAF
jgi:capsid protein